MSARLSRVVLAASLAASLSPAFLAGQTIQELDLRHLFEPHPSPSLTQARLLAGADEIPPERLEEIHRLYARAVVESLGFQKVEAYNSYGVFLLRQGEPERAAVVLFLAKSALELFFTPTDSPVYWKTDVEPDTHSRLLYNYGVALERSGEPEKAAPVFLQAFDLDPSFMPACDAVFRTSSNLRVPVVKRLLERGDLATARDYLRTSFQENRETYPELTALWARYLTAARIGPGQDHGIGTLRPDWLDATTQERLALIDKAYGGELPLHLDPAEGRAFTKPWQEPEDAARAFSGLLQMIGDELVKQGRPREAVAHYALAWSSAGNLDAATRLAGLLRSARAEVDPQREVLGKLISVFFDGAGTAHLPAGDPRVPRFHTALALLFESDEGGKSADGPRSAIYQWERALAAHQGLAAEEPAPGLYAHLATAYKQAGRTDEALSQFLAAGRQYLAAGRTEAAEAQLFRAEELATGKTGEAEQLAGLRTAIQTYEPRTPGGRTDGEITTDFNYILASDPSLRGKVWDVTTVQGSVIFSFSDDVFREIDKDAFKRFALSFPDVYRVELKYDPRH